MGSVAIKQDQQIASEEEIAAIVGRNNQLNRTTNLNVLEPESVQAAFALGEQSLSVLGDALNKQVEKESNIADLQAGLIRPPEPELAKSSVQTGQLALLVVAAVFVVAFLTRR